MILSHFFIFYILINNTRSYLLFLCFLLVSFPHELNDLMEHYCLLFINWRVFPTPTPHNLHNHVFKLCLFDLSVIVCVSLLESHHNLFDFLLMLFETHVENHIYDFLEVLELYDLIGERVHSYDHGFVGRVRFTAI